MSDKYTKEEKGIMEAVEKGTYTSVGNLDKEKKRYSEYAAKTLRKDKRVNIRISERDLEAIQRKAMEEGIPYQTLISSLLHKYVNGRIAEIDAVKNYKTDRD